MTDLSPEQSMLPFEMGTIPSTADAQAKRGWKVAINGEPIEQVSDAGFINPKIGIEITYGQRPEGYDGVVIREPGGAATMPYMVDEDGTIFVGVVEESRPTMGEAKTKNIPRGFSNFGESKEETAKRELREETGYRALGSRMVKLAEGLNPNSTFFDYSHSPEEGVAIFAVPVEAEELDIDYDDDGNVYYIFPAHVREQAEGDKTAERILGSRFIPLTEAMKSRDMFTAAAAGHLAVYLLSQGEYLLPQNPREALKANKLAEAAEELVRDGLAAIKAPLAIEHEDFFRTPDDLISFNHAIEKGKGQVGTLVLNYDAIASSEFNDPHARATLSDGKIKLTFSFGQDFIIGIETASVDVAKINEAGEAELLRRLVLDEQPYVNYTDLKVIDYSQSGEVAVLSGAEAEAPARKIVALASRMLTKLNKAAANKQ